MHIDQTIIRAKFGYIEWTRCAVTPITSKRSIENSHRVTNLKHIKDSHVGTAQFIRYDAFLPQLLDPANAE